MGPFFTKEDDLRFRRTTWLLSKLQAIGPPSEDQSLSATDAVALQQLGSLATLFVRQHEVVAVIPAIPAKSTAVYITTQTEEQHFENVMDITTQTETRHLENVMGGSCYVTRNPRRQV
jgi:hypothetical protein